MVGSTVPIPDAVEFADAMGFRTRELCKYQLETTVYDCAWYRVNEKKNVSLMIDTWDQRVITLDANHGWTIDFWCAFAPCPRHASAHLTLSFNRRGT